MKTKIRLAIIDDHKILCECLTMQLAMEKDIEVVANAGNGKDGIKMVLDCKIDVLLLDISLPDQSGLEVINSIRRYNKDILILVFSMYDEVHYALRCLKLGASGYINKGASSKELIGAIHTVFKGKKYITHKVAELLAENHYSGYDKDSHESLSKREFQVFSMISNGESVGEIATKVCLSVKTISMYRARLLTKLQLRNNAEIMRYAIQNHIVI